MLLAWAHCLLESSQEIQNILLVSTEIAYERILKFIELPRQQQKMDIYHVYGFMGPV